MTIDDTFHCLRQFSIPGGGSGRCFCLPELEKQGLGELSRMPVSLRVVLESLVRNCDGRRVREQDVKALAAWRPVAPRTAEVPFVVARILLQDFTGVPLLVDLAAMRSAVQRAGKDPRLVEPLVPVDLVVDHSVQVDYSGSADALQLNLEKEFERNRARYEFLKWGTQAFEKLKIVPPGFGICHHVNLEQLAPGVIEGEGGLWYPDSLVGTDSHTTMINGLGVVGWGVGGIEAEAGMLGQPVYFLMPDVVGVHLQGALKEGVTATDLVLRVTELLRQTKVVGKFVEFFGEGAASLGVPDRATLSNMAPEYGATMGFFPPDEATCRYLEMTGRPKERIEAFRAYYTAQGMFGMPGAGQLDYSQVVELDLSSIAPSVAGPRRPQDRIELSQVQPRFRETLARPDALGYARAAPRRVLVDLSPSAAVPAAEVRGGGKQDPDTIPNGRAQNTNTLTETEMMNNRPTPDRVAGPGAGGRDGKAELGDGDVVIAAITSCTNTSNPSVMLAAGLVAKKAVERGLKVRPTVKTSLAPGSRVVTDYLAKTGLQTYLDQLGFQLVGYGCTTCIGNSGPLAQPIEDAIGKNDLVVASVLSGNRNFEARIHQAVKANFLMSPPLVVAFALAGRVDIDFEREPVGKGHDGADVFLKDLWPTTREVGDLLAAARDPESYRRRYQDTAGQSPLWDSIPTGGGRVYAWEPTSTYVREPPYFEGLKMQPEKVQDIHGARLLALFGDSVTTDHISPAGSIKPRSPAGIYLQSHGVAVADFNSYGSRRGNHEVMERGTFANVRIKNLLVPGVEGGVTKFQPTGTEMSLYDASVSYRSQQVPLMVVAGQEYGTGSSRDWAAKGAALLGVRAVVAQSFERIHRSNLVGMGVLPVQLKEGTSARSLGLDGTELLDLEGLESGIIPRKEVSLVIHRQGGKVERVPVILRIDTPIEVDYYSHGGILQYVLRQLLA
ncbi:MAG: aconitate hydratase [Deltaproteobacteria bacterium]|nr:aconitate hydratase [Deltaproteobacteria bacterium]